MIAIFHYCAQKIASIDSYRLEQDCRHFLESIVDGFRSLQLFPTRKLHRRVNRPVGERLDRFVDRHRLLALDDEFQGSEIRILTGDQNLTSQALALERLNGSARSAVV